jgi:hypothetical protein
MNPSAPQSATVGLLASLTPDSIPAAIPASCSGRNKGLNRIGIFHGAAYGVAHAAYRVLFLAVCWCLAVLGASRADAGYGISDNAQFFSEYARAESLKIVEQISDTLRKDLYVETFERVPEPILKEFKGVDLKNPGQSARLYETWAARQASKRRVNGVYVLVVRQPAHLQVVVGNETRKGAFTGKDRDQLVKLMLGRLREKKHDEALLEGAGFVSAVMHSNAPGGRAAGRAGALDAPDPGDLREGGLVEKLGGWGTILIGVFAVWLLFRVLGGLFGGLLGGMGGSAGFGGSGMYPGNAGGGFFRSLMGGLFGAAAGMWMYDQFFGNHGHASESTEDTDHYTGHDTEYSGSGGDFDDSPADDGSDSGGFDSGDFGGGGDFDSGSD